MPTRVKEQLAIDEKVIEDKELERLLEERQKVRDEMAEVRADLAKANEAANGAIAKLELPDGVPVRIGRFRLTRVEVDARHVEFDTDARSRVRIAVLE